MPPELEQSEFGIICLTQENAEAPWLLFEAGAIAKKFGTSLVVPYIIDELSSASERSPLAQFQHVRADRDGTYRLVESINNAMLPSATRVDRLGRSFPRWWPDLEKTLQDIQTSNRPVPRSDRELLETIWQLVEGLWQGHRESRESAASLPGEELQHLQNLSHRPATLYERSGILQKELRHLRDIGLIKNRKPIAELPASFPLNQCFDLTDEGKRYLHELETPQEARKS
jgi:hypothetical protein